MILPPQKEILICLPAGPCGDASSSAISAASPPRSAVSLCLSSALRETFWRLCRSRRVKAVKIKRGMIPGKRQPAQFRVFVPEGRCESSPGLQSWDGIVGDDLVLETRLSRPSTYRFSFPSLSDRVKTVPARREGTP